MCCINDAKEVHIDRTCIGFDGFPILERDFVKGAYLRDSCIGDLKKLIRVTLLTDVFELDLLGLTTISTTPNLAIARSKRAIWSSQLVTLHFRDTALLYIKVSIILKKRV